MIKDLKFALRCMKYAYNKKLYSLMFVFFLILGAMNFSLGNRMNYISGGFMFVVAPSLLCQMFQTMNMSNLVLASPRKKRMENQILTILNILCVLIGFLLFTVAIAIVYSLGRCPAEDIGYLYTVMGILDVLMLVYTAVSYKFYIVSSVVFILGFAALYIMVIDQSRETLLNVSISSALGGAIAVACVILGGLAFMLISRIVYKYPMDKRAMQSKLKNEL